MLNVAVGPCAGLVSPARAVGCPSEKAEAVGNELLSWCALISFTKRISIPSDRPHVPMLRSLYEYLVWIIMLDMRSTRREDLIKASERAPVET
jgi:hypothetical protein